MRRLLFLFPLFFLAACGSAPKAVSEPVEPASTSTSSIPAKIETAIPTSSPTAQPTLSILTFDSPGTDNVPLETITSFAEMPGNLATGQPAPDFSARLLGGGRFDLSKERGKYWLILPTAIGCGECLYSLNLLRQAQPESPASLNILVLDIYQPDLPEYWQSYADAINQPNYRWAVLDTPTFMEDYDIYRLGTFLVIDPDGKLVFHSDSPLPPEHIAHLFKLAR